jgi:hypothetical protein
MAQTTDRKRPHLAVICAIVCASLLAACGDDGDGDDAGDPTAATQATATQPAETPSGASATPAERAAALCASPAQPATSTVEVPELVETSGIAASDVNADRLWAHNDSGDVPRLVLMSTAGSLHGVMPITNAEAVDWEDMAIGPAAPGGDDYVYVGDIGDNAAARPEIVAYRFLERRALPPQDGVTETIAVERIALRYADGPHDAETLMIDPLTGDLIIVSKEIVAGDSGVYVAAADALAAGSATLERAGTITKATLTSPTTPPDDASALVRGVGWLPTSGDISRDGALIAIRTYASVFIWSRADGQTAAEALAGTPCEAPSMVEPQGEAIAFTPDGDGYYTVSEGANPPLYRFGGQ